MNDPEIEAIMKRKMKELMQRAAKPIIEVNMDNFQKLLTTDKPILLDFWAPWCAPCSFMHPIFEKVAREYAGKILFAKVNVDENQSIAVKYEIQAIPTLILLINGKIVERSVGVMNEGELRRMVEKHVK